MSEPILDLDKKRFDKAIKKAIAASEKEDGAMEEFNRNILDAYRTLEDPDLLQAKLVELGLTSMPASNSKRRFAVVSASLPEKCRFKINRALSAQRVAEAIEESGAHAHISIPEDKDVTRALVAGLVDREKEDQLTLQSRVQAAQEIADSRGRKVVNRQDAKDAKEAVDGGVQNIRSFAKQRDDMAVALRVIHALQQIVEAKKELRASRVAKIITSEENSEIKKQLDAVFETAWNYLVELDQEIQE